MKIDNETISNGMKYRVKRIDEYDGVKSNWCKENELASLENKTELDKVFKNNKMLEAAVATLQDQVNNLKDDIRWLKETINGIGVKK